MSSQFAFEYICNVLGFTFCIVGPSFTTAKTELWSEVPGITLTDSTNDGLFAMKRSNLSFSLVGSDTIF